LTAAAEDGAQTVHVTLTGTSGGTSLTDGVPAYYTGTTGSAGGSTSQASKSSEDDDDEVAAAGSTGSAVLVSSATGAALPSSVSAGTGGMATTSSQFPGLVVVLLAIVGLVLSGSALAVGRRGKAVRQASR
jgi:hypothetical protein